MKLHVGDVVAFKQWRMCFAISSRGNHSTLWSASVPATASAPAPSVRRYSPGCGGSHMSCPMVSRVGALHLKSVRVECDNSAVGRELRPCSSSIELSDHPRSGHHPVFFTCPGYLSTV
jgi:hypothetical protein